jgi:hypothetical protein
MSEEVETNQPEVEAQYQERLDYENMLKMQIMNVSMAINAGYDGYNNAQVLITLLIPELREMVADDLRKAKVELKKEADRAKAYQASHTSRVIGKQPARKVEQQHKAQMQAIARRNYSLKILNVVVLALHDRGMLLSQEKQLDVGGY